jgi:glyoxylase-like metal-dependent hydrolase (beta-lactamase superfamily II)
MEKIADNVYKFVADCCVYFIDDKEKIIIDTGIRSAKAALKKEISAVIDPAKINKVIFTHLHYDHIGNFDLFPNAKFYASEQEIEFFEKDRYGTILNLIDAKNFEAELRPLTKLEGFDIIHVPGHTLGSVCLLYKKHNILFSGDTLFRKGIGRTDLPSSAAADMEKTQEKLKSIKYEILAPGHEY